MSNNHYKKQIALYSALIIVAILLLIPNVSYAQGWHEFKFGGCPGMSGCCNYSKYLSYDSEKCALTDPTGSGWEPNRLVWLESCNEYPAMNNDITIGSGAAYPTDGSGEPLPSYGGCGETPTHYDCPADNSVYADADSFNTTFSDITEWSYFNSDSSKCMASYTTSSGATAAVYSPSEYASVDPAGNDNCMSNDAFNALTNDSSTCGSPPTAFNNGSYVTSGVSEDCFDSNGDGKDDENSDNACAFAGRTKPDANLGGNVDCQANGAPVWEVNEINMNLFMTDIPIWHDTPIGPKLELQISYNSEADVISDSPFGNKWVFNYGSYLVEDGTTGDVTVTMPDGREDNYTYNNPGYSAPFGIYNVLSQVLIEEEQVTYWEVRLLDDTLYRYDLTSGKLVKIIDVYGKELNIAYSGGGVIETVTDATGAVMTFHESSTLPGIIDSVSIGTVPDVRTAYFVHDENNPDPAKRKNLITITDMGGLWTDLTYDANSYISSLTNDRGTTDFYIEPADPTYNDSSPYPAPGAPMWKSHRITITDPLGNSEEYYYNGMRTWYISKNDYQPYVSSEDNNLTNPKKTTYIFDRSNPKGKVRKIKNRAGGITSMVIDNATGKPSSITDEHGDTTVYTYNAKGMIETLTDDKGNTTSYAYDLNNGVDLVSISRNGTILKAFTYYEDSPGVSLHAIKELKEYPSGDTGPVFTTLFAYDSLTDQLTTMTEAEGTTVELETTFDYYPDFRLQRINKSGNATDTFTYDSKGRVLTHTDARGVMLTYAYDNLNRIKTVSYPDTKSESYSYSDCCPRMIKKYTDRSGRITRYKYDKAKRLTHVAGPAGIIRYEYDADGNMTKLTDADGKYITFQYDYAVPPATTFSITKKYWDIGGIELQSVVQTFDSAGLLTQRTGSRGITTDYYYDENHNLRYLDYSGSTLDVEYAYDNYDRVIEMSRGDYTNQPQPTLNNKQLQYFYGYDNLHRLTSLDGPWANDDITYEYNELSHRIKLTAKTDGIPGNDQVIDYKYDYDIDPVTSLVYPEVNAGRLKAIIADTNTFTYDYSPEVNEKVNPLVHKLTRPN
ncbi:MAG: RHS repeat protein, partial [Nitrospira sp.]|nr:RHS repeat protein [Nitrospira sp.]